MNLRPMTAQDVIGMIAASKSRQIGEYVQPTVLGRVVNGAFVPLGQRRHLRVTERTEHPGRPPFGDGSVEYRGVDVQGEVFEFWPSDDPRPSTEAEWRAERAL